MLEKYRILKLHWRLLIPLVVMMWLIIGVTMTYFIEHEKQRQQENLENRLLNINNTVITAYENGADLQSTVKFIRLFTDDTALTPLMLTVYNADYEIIADNFGKTIMLYDSLGRPRQNLLDLIDSGGSTTLKYFERNDQPIMVSAKASNDGRIYTFAALPFESEVVSFMRTDRMVWIVVFAMALLTSLLAYVGVRAVCRNVYSLRDYVHAIATDNLTDVNTLRFSKDELGDVLRDITALYRDKMNAEQAKTSHEHQIVLNVSHELNTPLGIIKGYIDTVLEDPDMPADIRQKFLLKANISIERLANLTTDIRTLMRLDDTTTSTEMTPVNVKKFMTGLTEDIIYSHIAEDMNFNFDIPDDIIVSANESWLANVILNLISNSARYSNGTSINLSYEGEADGQHIFAFSDNGIGVPEEHLDHLFDMFYRVDKGRSRKKGGTGLGLTLVKRIINSMGGDITVDNAIPSGLKFTITLPVAQ